METQPVDDTQRRPRWLVATVCAVAGLLHLVATQWVLLAHGVTRLRAFSPGDQLGYLAISTDVLHGVTARVEPYTQTGVNTYPRAYYATVGLVGRLLGLGPVTAWNLVGMAIQLVMAAGLALSLVLLARRWWAGLLAPVVLLLGCFSWVLSGTWRTHLGGSHAVLNGPFATLSVLNGESAGLATGVLAGCLLAIAWLRDGPTPWRTGLTAVACGLVGLVSGVQTYSFIFAVWLLCATGAAWAVLVQPRRRWQVATGVLLVLLYLLGPVVARVAGQLPTLVFALLPTLPGLWLLARRTGRRFALWAGVLVVAAAPQVLTTLHDQAGGDPFLSYRTASNVGLGVLHPATLLASLPVAVPLVVLAVVTTCARDARLGAPVWAALGCLLVAPTNDLWGANAEPYRFWIESCLFAAVVAALAGAGWLAQHPLPTGRGRAVLALVLLPAVLSLPDHALWAGNPSVNRTWDPQGPLAVATAGLAGRTEGSGLLLADPCLDPQKVQTLSGRPVAYYRLGMAWPARRAAIDEVLSQAAAGRLEAASARAADVGWVLTDTACRVSLAPGLPRIGAVEVARAGHAPDDGLGAGTLVLWRLP